MKSIGACRFMGTFRAVAIALPALAVGQAQQTPVSNSGAPPASNLKVVVAGENPAIRKLDKEGGKAVTDVNFWRVEWSPVGAGAVCFVTVRDQPSDNLRIAIYDNEAVLEHVTKLMHFQDPPFTPLKGTITQTNAGTTERRETCKSDQYTVDLDWKGLGEGRWIDMKMGPITHMTFVMVAGTSGEVLINGKPGPGTWYPTGGGMGPGAFLTVNETWRQ